MDARAQVVGQLLRMLILALALWVAIEALDFRGPGGASSRAQRTFRAGDGPEKVRAVLLT